jgi:hypothetical protein
MHKIESRQTIRFALSLTLTLEFGSFGNACEDDSLSFMKARSLVLTYTMQLRAFASNSAVYVELCIQMCGPFSGWGYFTVQRTTLTAMLSTTVTYLIVLIQTPQSSRTQ